MKDNIFLEFNYRTEDEILNILRSIQNEMDRVQKEKRPNWVINQLTEHFGKSLNPTVIELLAGQFFSLNSHVDTNVKPDWLDMEKFRRGQKFAVDNVASLFYSSSVAFVFSSMLISTLQPVVITGQSSTPFSSFRRYLKTNLIFLNMYTSDPWIEGTPAYKGVQKINRIHIDIQKKLQRMSYEEYLRNATIENVYCPNLSFQQRDFESGCPASGLAHYLYDMINNKLEQKHKFFTQCDMEHTQFSFLGLCITYPKYFGIHYATDEDLEALCHTWRALGYLVGIDDSFNYCRGTLEEVRTRTRDLLGHWAKAHLRNITPEWGHIISCVIEGLNYFLPATSYEIYILELAHIINVNMPRVYNSMSYFSWINYKIIRMYCDYASKLFPSLCTFVNHRILLYYQRASNFDAEKLEKLKVKSEKTLELYFKNLRVKKSENHGGMTIYVAITFAIFVVLLTFC